MIGISPTSGFPLMPLFRLCRAAALLIAFCASVPAPASAAGADPAQLITSIYAHGHEEAVWAQLSGGSKRGPWLTRDLTALWGGCDARGAPSKGKEGALDFDVLENSQMGWEAFAGYTVSVVSQSDGRAAVDARLQRGPNTGPAKFDSDNVIHYDLIQEGGAWKIDDVRSSVDGKPWSLRKILNDKDGC